MESTSNQGRVYSCDDEASPRCVLEIQVPSTDSDRSSGCSSCSPGKSSPLSSSAAERMLPPLGRDVHLPQWKGVMDAFRINSRRLTSLPLITTTYMMSRRSLRKLARIRSAEDSVDLSAFRTKASWKNFPYSDLAAATDGFNPGKDRYRLSHNLRNNYSYFLILFFFTYLEGRLCDFS